jgi:large repetitive protein
MRDDNMAMQNSVIGLGSKIISRKLASALFGAVLVGVSGCQCAKDDCADLEVRFVSPSEGDNVNAMIDVEVRGSTRGGADVDIDEAKISVRNTASGRFGDQIDGTFEGAKGIFRGVALTAGENALRAELKKKGTTCRFVSAINVNARGSMGEAKVTAVSFPQDTNSDGTLTLTEVPLGTPIVVKVKTVNGAGVSSQIRNTAGEAVLGGPSMLTMDEVSISLDKLAEPFPAELTVFAELLRGTAVVNTRTQNPEAVGTIRLKRAVPTCANTTPMLVGGTKDADPNVAGFQLRATSTVGPNVTQAIFTLSGTPPQTKMGMPMGGSFSADFTIPAMGDVTYTLKLEAKDADGNACVAEKMVRANFVKPTVAITAPMLPAMGAVNVTMSPLTVTGTSNAADGSTACFFQNKAGGMRMMVACTQLANGSFSGMVPFAMDGAYEVTVEVTDAVGNTNAVTFETAVMLQGCGVAFTMPSACGGALFASDLTAGNYDVSYSSPMCVGRPTRLKVNGVAKPDAVVGAGGVVGPIASMLNVGKNTLRAEVDNMFGTTNFAECEVTYDPTKPSFVQPVPASPAVKINADQDSQVLVPGAQRLLQIQVSQFSGRRIEICTSQATNPVNGTARAACPNGAAGSYLLQSDVAEYDNAFTFPEGNYDLTIVVASGMRFNTSDPVAFQVDATRPCATAAGLTLGRDNGAGNALYAADGRINGAEFAQSALPFISLDFSGCGDTAATLATSNAIVLKRVVNGTVIPLSSGTTTVTQSGTTANVFLSGLTGQTVENYFVELTDAAGNVNRYFVDSREAKTVPVNLTPPVCVLTSPTGTLLGQDDAPGGNLTVSVQTSSDVSTGGVTVTLTGPSTIVVTPTVSNGTANGVAMLSGDATWTASTVCVDVAGNSVTAAPWTGEIDLQAPTCAFTAPTAGATVTSNTVPTSLAISGAEGASVTVKSTGQAAAIGTLLVSGGTATDSLIYPNGAQTITATVKDNSDNECVATVNITVNSTGCTLSLTNVFNNAGVNWLNLSNTTSTGVGTATVALAGTSSCSAGETVTFKRIAPTVGMAQTTTTDGMGGFVFNGAVADGERYEVTITSATNVTSTKSISVDLIAPTFSGFGINGNVSTVPNATFFVAAGTNKNILAGTAGYYSDQSGAVGAQFTSNIAGAAGAAGGAATVSYAGAAVRTVPATNGAFAVNATLPHNTTGALEVRLRDAAGNAVVVYSGNATVDVVAPGAPAVAAMTPTRAGALTLNWAATFDDGTDVASGPHQGYESRWTTQTVPQNNSLSNESDYFGAAAYKEPTNSTADATTRTLALPPLSTYFIAVRAIDEIGNYSPFVAPASNGIGNLWQEIVLADSSTGTLFGQVIDAQSDLNGDGQKDIVIGAPSGSISAIGRVYVYFGGPGLVAQTGCNSATACQTLEAPAGGVAGGFFGIDASAGGNIGESGDDLVVGQRAWRENAGQSVATPPGRVILYFGVASGLLDTTAAKTIQIVGDSDNSRVGTTARIISDLDGDGLSEVLISAPGASAGIGKVFIFKGRTLAQWKALEVAPDNRVPVTAANWVLEGPNPKIPAGTDANEYGSFRNGVTRSLGDLNGDGKPELGIPLSRQSVSQYQLWSGATIAGSSALLPSTSALQQLSATVAANTSTAGFGQSVLTGPIADITGPGRPDLAIGNSLDKTISFYYDLGSGGTMGNPVVVTSPRRIGSELAAIDANEDGKVDVVVGEFEAVPTKAWMMLQQGNGAFQNPGEATSFFSFALPGSGSAGSTLGRAVATGDVTGDGKTDIVLGDQTLNLVRIYR